MALRQRLASGLLYCVAAVLLLFAVVANVLDVLPPHVEGFTGLLTDEVQPEVLQTFLILAKAIGVLYVSIGLTLVVIVRGPFRRGERWAKVAVATLVVPLVLLAAVTAPFLPYGLMGPQTYPYVLVGLTVLALVLSPRGA